MEINRNLIRYYFSKPAYLSSLFFLSQPLTGFHSSITLNHSLSQIPQSTIFLHSRRRHAKPTSQAPCASISSTGFHSFTPATFPVSQSLIYPASYNKGCLSLRHSSFSPWFVKPHVQFRLLSELSFDKNSELKNNIVVGSDKTQPSVKIFDKFVIPERISEIIDVIRRGEDDLEFRLNLIVVNLSVHSLSGIFRFLNGEKISALRFFHWARGSNPSLYRSSDACSLIIDNCGWLEDYETMLCLLKDFKSKGICLNEMAFGFLPVLGATNASIRQSIRRVVELLNEVGGSSGGSGICALLKMLCQLNLFDMAKFVIEITDRKVHLYNILVREKCRRCCLEEACGMLDEMREFGCAPDTKTYNYLLSTLCKHGRLDEACYVLEEMKEKGCPPDPLTFEIVICFSCRLGKLDAAVQFLDQMVSRGIEPRVTTHAAFIKGYFFSRQLEAAYNYVVSSSIKYKHSSNIIHSLLASLHQKRGDFVTAGNILFEMMEKGLIPNFEVYITTLKQLHKSGRGQLARNLKVMFSRLRSDSSTMT